MSTRFFNPNLNLRKLKFTVCIKVMCCKSLEVPTKTAIWKFITITQDFFALFYSKFGYKSTVCICTESCRFLANSWLLNSSCGWGPVLVLRLESLPLNWVRLVPTINPTIQLTISNNILCHMPPTSNFLNMWTIRSFAINFKKSFSAINSSSSFNICILQVAVAW